MRKTFCVLLFLLVVSAQIRVFSADKQNIQKWSSSLPKKLSVTIDKEIQDRVDFWKLIYSKYSTYQGVFHYVDHPSKILGEVDVTDIYSNYIYNESTKSKLAKYRIEASRSTVLKQWKIKNPKSIRLQMGLRDRTLKAFYQSGRYLPMMERVFVRKGLPAELTRLVFVESSFNIHAQSKVGASGLWQIMPSVAKQQGYIASSYDKRNHPYYATLLAGDILLKNYRSLNSWPLAITAYNHGATGVQRRVSKVGSRSIAQLIKSPVKTNAWGFASENFYACFLAMLEVEKNANILFGEQLSQLKPIKAENIYLKTAIEKNEVLGWYGGSFEKFKTYNPHVRLSFLKNKDYFPAGIPLVRPIARAN